MKKLRTQLKTQLTKFGTWFFLFGIVVAILAGFFVGITQLGIPVLSAIPGWLATMLVLLGFVIGFVNITKKESVGFLVSVIGLSIVSGMMSWALPMIGGLLEVLKAISTTLLMVVAPAAFVVVIASIIRYTKKR